MSKNMETGKRLGVGQCQSSPEATQGSSLSGNSIWILRRGNQGDFEPEADPQDHSARSRGVLVTRESDPWREGTGAQSTRAVILLASHPQPMPPDTHLPCRVGAADLCFNQLPGDANTEEGLRELAFE
jgi:hypothetical protein